jgi:hypothetical protein
MIPVATDVVYWEEELDSADYGVVRHYANGMTITHEPRTAQHPARYVIVLPDGLRRIFEHRDANQSRGNAIRRVAALLAEWLESAA